MSHPDPQHDAENVRDDDSCREEEDARRQQEICQHTERPNVLSLPGIPQSHMCRECWDTIAAPQVATIPRSREPSERAYGHNGWLYGVSERPTYSKTERE